MKVLFCFDVDGTLETSQGPVKVEVLQRLKQLPNSEVVIVSPSAAAPVGFEKALVGGQRRDNLLAARMMHEADLYLYISDNNDQGEAAAAGFVYIDRMAFWQGHIAER